MNAQDGILRLEALVAPDLHNYIDPASRTAQVGWGVFFTVLHQIRAVLTLHHRDVCFSAAPNRRTIIEYILFLVWLADDGEAAVDVLNRATQNNQKQLATNIGHEALMQEFPEHVRETLAETIAAPLAPHPDERLMKPWHLIESYDHRLKAYYLAESRFSHVSITSVQFFAKSVGEELHLTQMPEPREPMACLDFCLHTLSQAMLTFNEILQGHPWTDELLEIANDYGLDPRRPVRRTGNSNS